MTKKIAVVGRESFILGFQLAGIREARRAEGDDYVDAVEHALQDPELGILVVDAEDAAGLPPRVRGELTESVDPVVIRVGAAGMGDLREKVKQAIGIDLYKDEADATEATP